MISNLVKDGVRTRMDQVGRLLARTGLTPDMASILGLLINGAVAVVLATGRFGLGGVLLLIAAPFDMVDGALARATGKGSRYGAFLDSMLDRYSEVVLFFGLLWHFQHDAAHAETRTLLLYACATGSLLVSYARARAEALGFDNEVGILARPERIVGLGAFLLFGWTDVILWLLAVLTYVTAIQRLLHVWRRWRRTPPGPAAPPTGAPRVRPPR